MYATRFSRSYLNYYDVNCAGPSHCLAGPLAALFSVSADADTEKDATSGPARQWLSSAWAVPATQWLSIARSNNFEANLQFNYDIFLVFKRQLIGKKANQEILRIVFPKIFSVRNGISHDSGQEWIPRRLRRLGLHSCPSSWEIPFLTSKIFGNIIFLTSAAPTAPTMPTAPEYCAHCANYTYIEAQSS